MRTGRPKGVSPTAISRRLEETPFQWNNRPGWDYVGKDRVRYGVEVDPRAFSIRTQTTSGIIWTVDMQAWAVTHGFFVGREPIRERPVIIGINRYDSTFSYVEPERAMQEIERRTFRRYPRYGILLDFIKQQDQYGYTGAWDKNVQIYTPDLLWYKLYRQANPQKVRRHETLVRNLEKARDAKYLNRVRYLIRKGSYVVNQDGI